jgi:hypothetical protein
VFLHPGDGVSLAHFGYLSLAEAYLSDEQVDEFGGEGLGGHPGLASVRLYLVLDARPELSFGGIELISQDVRPDRLSVCGPVRWM